MSSDSNIRDSRMTIDSNQLAVSNCSYKYVIFILLLNILNVSAEVSHCDYDCLYPRRPETEAQFNSVGHHERSSSLKEMMDKINVRIIGGVAVIVVLLFLLLQLLLLLLLQLLLL
jgi:hypothetical protein